MRLISTDEMVFIGPGSEWFWTAVSGLVLAVTFVAIYRQLTLARSANAFTQLNALVDEWQGERLVRKLQRLKKRDEQQEAERAELRRDAPRTEDPGERHGGAAAPDI